VNKIGLTYILHWSGFLCKTADDSVSYFFALIRVLTLVVPNGRYFSIWGGLIRRDLSGKR
jgi:hypothetical protein